MAKKAIVLEPNELAVNRYTMLHWTSQLTNASAALFTKVRPEMNCSSEFMKLFDDLNDQIMLVADAMGHTIKEQWHS